MTGRTQPRLCVVFVSSRDGAKVAEGSGPALTAQFTDASGVFKGDAVKLAGVDVGRVQRAKIENGLAAVTFTMSRSV